MAVVYHVFRGWTPRSVKKDLYLSYLPEPFSLEGVKFESMVNESDSPSGLATKIAEAHVKFFRDSPLLVRFDAPWSILLDPAGRADVWGATDFTSDLCSRNSFYNQLRGAYDTALEAIGAVNSIRNV